MVPVKKTPDIAALGPECSDRDGPAPASAAESPLRGRGRGRIGSLALLAAALLFFTAGLGGIDLWAPDEPRYAAIAEELRSGRHGPGGLVLLHLNDEPYSQKPPLYFWLAAAAGLVSGRVDEVAARLPSALAGVASVMTTVWIAGLARMPRAAGWLAAALLATSFRFAFTARRAQLDVLLCAFELLAIALFLVLETRRGGVENARDQPALIAGLHAALGAAALVKGPVGWLPLLVFAVYLAWEGRRAAFRRLVPYWSWLFSIAPLALWIAAATALAPDGFAGDAVGTNVFARFFAGTSHARPFYYYAYQLPLDFMPWTLLLASAGMVVWRAARSSPAAPIGSKPLDGGVLEGSTARLLVSWILVPLAFFSLSAGKRGLYLLPIFPALALTLAFALAAQAAKSPDRGPRRLRTLVGAVVAVAILELAGALFLLPRLDLEKSPRPIAQSIASHAGPREIVGLFGLRPLEGAISYYGDRRVRSIANEAQAVRFVTDEGRLILMRAGDLHRLRRTLGLEILEHFRSGSRELVLARAVIGAHPRDAAP